MRATVRLAPNQRVDARSASFVDHGPDDVAVGKEDELAPRGRDAAVGLEREAPRGPVEAPGRRHLDLEEVRGIEL